MSGLGLYSNGFLKVLNLRVLAPLSRLAFLIGTWLVLERIFKSSEFAGVGSAVEVGFYNVGTAVEVGFYYRGLACTKMSKSSERAVVGSAVEVGFYYRGLACIRMDFSKF